MTVKLSDDTVLGILTYAWRTPGQICDYLRQCGPLTFVGGDSEYMDFRYAVKRHQYQAVHRTLRKLVKSDRIDCAIGDDKGNLVRVYCLFYSSVSKEKNP